MPRVIYKVIDGDTWSEVEAAGQFVGAEIDLADGFIHFSTAAQVEDTVAKHFADRVNLVLVAVDAEKLGEQLKWEPSRGGDLFPHCYGAMSLDAVLSVVDLPLGKGGRHLFPTLERD